MSHELRAAAATSARHPLATRFVAAVSLGHNYERKIIIKNVFSRTLKYVLAAPEGRSQVASSPAGVGN